MYETSGGRHEGGREQSRERSSLAIFVGHFSTNASSCPLVLGILERRWCVLAAGTGTRRATAPGRARMQGLDGSTG